MTGYFFLSSAEEEMIGASIFYQEASQNLGADFLGEVQRTIDVRRTSLQRFPFSIIYAEESNAIVVVAIARHSRHPGYWRKRLDRSSNPSL